VHRTVALLERNMTTHDLLRAMRDVYVLAEKPDAAAGSADHLWSMRLDGLHQDHLRDAVAQLRKQHLPRADSGPKKRDLKSVRLLDSLSRALGVKSYDQWLDEGQQKIDDFLSEQGMSQPADLIKWAYPPGLAGALTTQKVSDRLFNSRLPLPQRIFTGVGSFLFAPSGYGRLDINDVAKRTIWTDQERYAFCMQNADKVLLHAEQMKGDSGPSHLDLTGRMLMLNAVSEFIGCMYNMMGSNLSAPSIGNPVMRSYNMSEEERKFELQLFDLFRTEIERSNDGWVDVLPVPGNSNLIFLRGVNGTFDWVVRDQRDKRFSSNPLHPFFTKDEVPKAMDQSKLNAHLYFSTGTWQEKLEHDAESRHYAEGGTAGNWPGYLKLVQRELIASQGYGLPRPQTGAASKGFVRHRINGHCLMVSPLVTIDEFFNFHSVTDWGQARQEGARKADWKLEGDLHVLNSGDAGDLPVSVTWLDAVAYCRDFERRTGLPVRLMEVEEWREIVPDSPLDFSGVSTVRSIRVKRGEPMPDDPIYEQLGWGVVGGDGKLGANSSNCHGSDGSMMFRPDLQWTSSSEGARFLCVPGFGEWLSGYQHGSAPAACAATGQAVVGGEIERSLYPVRLTMQYKGAKVGFRLCYIAHPDA
jgi:hypothetical protein